ncbi:MAG: NADH-quinone oxidoreductase subunit J [Egibacteraceae bacterium]
MTLSLAAVLAQADPSLPATSGSAEFWVFWILAPIALGAAISMVVLRNPVHAALMLVVNFVVIALLFAVLEAQFLAVVQIIVYAGAIMVLFLFVLMLLGVGSEQEAGREIPGQRPVAILLGVLLFATLAVGVAGPLLGAGSACNVAPDPAATGPACRGLAAFNSAEGGNVRGIGELLFTTYVWPFEAASVLLVIAAVGAIILGRKRDDPTETTEAVAPVAQMPAAEMMERARAGADQEGVRQ